MSLGLGVAVQRISKALSRALRGLFSVGGKDPKLVFDFNNEYYRTNGGQKSFSNAMTFSRASSATMVDSTGTLITVPSGTPRIGHHVYNGDQWVNKGILVESEARTNVVTYSDQFNNAAWTKAAPTITADAIASPDGNDNADKLIESSTTAHAVYQVPTVTAVAYTFSVFAKSAERTQVNLDFTGGTNGAYFNLSTGEVISSSGTGLTAAITPMGNDWYRCSITQVQSAGAIYPSVSTSVGGARVYLGDGSSGIYIYGAQLEAGSTPSSYIPTNGSSVTRAAETVTVPYANLPYSSIAMSIAMMGELDYADEGISAQGTFWQWTLDTNNNMQWYLDTDGANTGKVRFGQKASGIYDALGSSSTAYAPNLNVPFNLASRHGSTFINGAVDGTALTANTTPTALPDLSTTDLNLAYYYMGTISEFRIWDRDIGDTGLVTATEPSLEPSLSLTFDGQPSSFTNTGLTV